MQGELLPESSPGEGTTMRVVIPMELTAALEEIEVSDTENSIDLSGLKILLVDDDRAGLKYLETVLAYFGAEVTSFPGGKFF